jgi:hypothetical protein
MSDHNQDEEEGHQAVYDGLPIKFNYNIRDKIALLSNSDRTTISGDVISHHHE